MTAIAARRHRLSAWHTRLAARLLGLLVATLVACDDPAPETTSADIAEETAPGDASDDASDDAAPFDGHDDGHEHDAEPGDGHEHDVEPGDGHEHDVEPGDGHEHDAEPGDGHDHDGHEHDAEPGDVHDHDGHEHDTEPDDPHDVTPDAVDADDAGGDVDRLVLAPHRASRAGAFETHGRCATCHSNSPTATAMRTPEGEPVGFFDTWQASMMANAARDPIWRAAVSVEAATTPEHAAAIENECSRCHAPMAYLEAQRAGELTPLSTLYGDDDLAQVGLDGVSCTLCHQIEADGLGSEASYSGHFAINGEREVYGPHEDLAVELMGTESDYVPVQSEHIVESSVCGSCHTLFTTPFREDGTPAETRFPEQTTYFEWRASAYDTERAAPGPDATSCGGCHMRSHDDHGHSHGHGGDEEISTRVARQPLWGTDYEELVPRSPYGVHTFDGGNTLVMGMLRDHREELGVVAPVDALEEAIERTRRHLRDHTASLDLVDAELDGDTARFGVRVINQAGHRFPTGIPLRRAWLQVRVVDAEGTAIFTSGAHDDRGRILGADGSPLSSELVGGGWQPHYEEVTSGSQAHVYEAVLADTEGRHTHRLTLAASWLKDNRLLPRGWDSEHPDATYASPVGIGDDEDFGAGGDIARYRVTVGAAARPLRIEATLLYQVVTPRHAAELLEIETEETAALRRFWDAADVRPELVAEITRTLGEP